METSPELGFHYGDDGSIEDDTQPQQEQNAPPEPSEQEKQAAEAARRAAEAKTLADATEKFKAFAGVIENLSLPQNQQTYVQPAPQQQPLSAEQLKKINEAITKGVLEGNAVEVIGPIIAAAGQAQRAQILNDAAPLISGYGSSIIENVKTRKSQDKHYKAYEAAYERELSDLDPASLLSMSEAQRQREFDRRWDAARGQVLGAKIDARPPQQPPNMSPGRQFGQPQPTTPAMDDHQRAVLKRYSKMSDEEVAAFETDMREGRV
jgi:hypothetical protein